MSKTEDATQKSFYEKMRPLAFGGHCFYVRKCLTGDPVNDVEWWRRQDGGIELPEQYADRSLCVQVLSIGVRCGEPCTDAHMDKFHRARHIPLCVDVGDIILCPNDSIGITTSPIIETEFFIEESVPLAIYKQPE